jgi:hypothetical protein
MEGKRYRDLHLLRRYFLIDTGFSAPFNFVDRKKGFLFNIEKAELKQAGEPVFRGEFQ